jgi:Ca-activated chloride channel family protein
MTIKQLFSTLVLSAFTFVSAMSSASVPSPQQIIVKSDLSSPIVMEGTQDKNYLKISLTGFGLESTKRSPINLALVIDRSTSMRGDRIEKAREAAILAVQMLDADDTLSVVAYDSNVEVVIPASKVKNKEALIKKINQYIQPQGMTALFAGVSKGINQVDKGLDKEKVNRIILLSDGQANVGPTSIGELSDLARIAAKKGISITTIGLGEGYNEDLMTAIAGYSDGNHTFVANSADLEKAFTKEFKDVMSVVAQDVVITIKTADNVKPVRLLGRDGDISGNTIKVRMNQLYSNQEKYVLLEVVPAKGSSDQVKPLANVTVSYDNLGSKKQDKISESVDIRYSKSADVVKKAVVEEVLVDSEIQIAALENEKAIQLMDQGKNDEAREILRSNAGKLSSLNVSSAPAAAKARASAEQNKKLADIVDSESSSFSRKAVKEQSYNVKNQQK